MGCRLDSKALEANHGAVIERRKVFAPDSLDDVGRVMVRLAKPICFKEEFFQRAGTRPLDEMPSVNPTSLCSDPELHSTKSKPVLSIPVISRSPHLKLHTVCCITPGSGNLGDHRAQFPLNDLSNNSRHSCSSLFAPTAYNA